MTDYLEGALEPGARRALEAHLAGCRACAEYLAQLRATIDLAGRTPTAVDAPTSRALAELYRSWKATPPEA